MYHGILLRNDVAVDWLSVGRWYYGTLSAPGARMRERDLVYLLFVAKTIWFGMPNLKDLVCSYLNEISENDNDDQLLTEYFDYLSDEFRIGKQNTFEKARLVF